MLTRINSKQVKNSVRPNTGAASGVSGLPPFISVGVLIAGVLGGLVVVLSAIFFCKPCYKWISRRKSFYVSKFLQRRRSDSSLGNKDRGRYENLELKLPAFPEVLSENTYVSRDKTGGKTSGGDKRGSRHDGNADLETRSSSPDNIDLVVASYKQSVLAKQMSLQFEETRQSPQAKKAWTNQRSHTNTPSSVGSICNESQDRSCLQLPDQGSDWWQRHESFLQSERACSFGGYSEPRKANPVPDRSTSEDAPGGVLTNKTCPQLTRGEPHHRKTSRIDLSPSKGFIGHPQSPGEKDMNAGAGGRAGGYTCQRSASGDAGCGRTGRNHMSSSFDDSYYKQQQQNKPSNNNNNISSSTTSVPQQPFSASKKLGDTARHNWQPQRQAAIEIYVEHTPDDETTRRSAADHPRRLSFTKLRAPEVYYGGPPRVPPNDDDDVITDAEVEEAVRHSRNRRQSRSLETDAPLARRASPLYSARKVRSYEETQSSSALRSRARKSLDRGHPRSDEHGKQDYDRFQITQFIKGPATNLDDPSECEDVVKVRYNDTGSFEEVDEVKVELLLGDTSDGSDWKYRRSNSAASAILKQNSMATGSGLNASKSRDNLRAARHPSVKMDADGRVVSKATRGRPEMDFLEDGGAKNCCQHDLTQYRYRDLWRLRTTLEETEAFSDVIRMDDNATLTSADEQEDEDCWSVDQHQQQQQQQHGAHNNNNQSSFESGVTDTKQKSPSTSDQFYSSIKHHGGSYHDVSRRSETYSDSLARHHSPRLHSRLISCSPSFGGHIMTSPTQVDDDQSGGGSSSLTRHPSPEVNCTACRRRSYRLSAAPELRINSCETQKESEMIAPQPIGRSSIDEENASDASRPDATMTSFDSTTTATTTTTTTDNTDGDQKIWKARDQQEPPTTTSSTTTATNSGTSRRTIDFSRSVEVRTMVTSPGRPEKPPLSPHHFKRSFDHADQQNWEKRQRQTDYHSKQQQQHLQQQQQQQQQQSYQFQQISDAQQDSKTSKFDRRNSTSASKKRKLYKLERSTWRAPDNDAEVLPEREGNSQIADGKLEEGENQKLNDIADSGRNDSKSYTRADKDGFVDLEEGTSSMGDLRESHTLSHPDPLHQRRTPQKGHHHSQLLLRQRHSHYRSSSCDVRSPDDYLEADQKSAPRSTARQTHSRESTAEKLDHGPGYPRQNLADGRPSAYKANLHVLSRFMRHNNNKRQSSRYRPPARDFSIDSVTDAVFNEFLRYDPKLELRSHRPQSTNQNSFFKPGSGTPPRRLDPVNEMVPRAPTISTPRSHRKDSIESHHTPVPNKLSPQHKHEAPDTADPIGVHKSPLSNKRYSDAHFHRQSQEGYDSLPHRHIRRNHHQQQQHPYQGQQQHQGHQKLTKSAQLNQEYSANLLQPYMRHHSFSYHEGNQKTGDDSISCSRSSENVMDLDQRRP